MKTKEVEKLTGLSKQTLIWYEKEGLIRPKRNENHYREYTEEDVQLLRLIKTLRSMNVSIDDIRQVLEKYLSVEQVLEEQEAYLQQESRTMKEMEEKVRFYERTGVPMLEELWAMYTPRTNWLGQEQPPESFHIGIRPDKKRIAKWMLWNVIWILFMLFLGCALVYRFEGVWERSMPSWVFAGWILIFMVLILFGFGLPQIGIGNFIQRYLDYAELSRDGIAYISAKTPGEELCFLWSVLRGRETMVFVPYEQIKQVVISHSTKYTAVFGVRIAYELRVTSFVFSFQDGSSYTILNRLFYENDEEIIIRILQEKVKNVKIKG